MKSYYSAVLFVSCLSFAQQTQFVDFKTAHGNIAVDYEKKSVAGQVTYDFEVTKSTDTIRIDAQQMEFSEVKLNGETINFHNTGKQLQLISKFRKGKNQLSFGYTATPKQTMYFVTAGNDVQVWTQGQGKYTSHWFPSFDDVNEKVVFNLTVTYDKNYKVISNGLLKAKEPKDNLWVWHYEMQYPMSSYLVVLAIGKFEKTELASAAGVPLELYLEAVETSKYEATYRYSKQLFDYLEKEIGVGYPWGVYRQVPVRDFLYGGMENTTATLFTTDYVVDEIGFNDRNYVNVNAHELAHQWFGDMVTAKSGKHHWLQEGFATYYALLAEKEVFGEDYFNWKLYENAESIQQASKTDSIPILNEKASSLSFYQKGAWALHVLRENIGPENFNKAVKAYLEKFRFKNVETADFLKEVEKISGYDVRSFQKRWLENGKFEVTEALDILKKSAFMRQYFTTGALEAIPFADKQQEFLNIMASTAYYPIKEEIIYQSAKIPYEEKKELLLAAMKTGEVHVRRAVAQTMRKVPADFQTEYASLLRDPSYLTQEIALTSLCNVFPENRVDYLDITDGSIGLNDKNVRIAWLALALTTNDYRPFRKSGYYQELLAYANPVQESSVRQAAMEKLLYLYKGDTNVLPLLAKSLVHHKWQLTKFARDKIRELLKGNTYRAYFEELVTTLPENEKMQLQRLLDEK